MPVRLPLRSFSCARPGPKKFCVLDMGDRADDDLSFEKKKLFTTPFSDYYRLNWRTPGDRYADFVLLEPNLFSEGRSVLLQLVPRAYRYYIFVDDDVIFYEGLTEAARSATTIPQAIATFFDEYHPLMGTFYNRDDWTQRPLNAERISREVAVPIKAYDITACFYHASVLDHFFPVPYHGTFGILWFQQYVCYETYPLKQMCFAGVSVRNTQHRGHPSDSILRKYEAMDLFNADTRKKNFDHRREWSNAAILSANESLARSRHVAQHEVLFGSSDLARVYDINSPAYRTRSSMRSATSPVVPRDTKLPYVAFGGDYAAIMVVGRIVLAYAIELAVVSGSDDGGRTTQFFARTCDSVRMVAQDETVLKQTRVSLAEFFGNVILAQGRTDVILRTAWLRSGCPDAVPDNGNVIFYLSRGSTEAWPLPSELTAVAALSSFKDRALVLIDGFRVPGRAFCYEPYSEGDCSLEDLEGTLREGYANSHEFVFLGQTSFEEERAAKGKLFLVPKRWGTLEEWTSSTIHSHAGFSYRFTSV
jgi:hypothetical protein